MLAKVGVVFLMSVVLITAESPIDWDVAVAVNEGIELLKSNGSVLPVTLDLFNDIKALTYHYDRREFIVADRNLNNDTIYLFNPSTMDLHPIVEDLPDDIQGIAVDPLKQMVFWADATNQSINMKSLFESNTDSFNTLLDFEEEFQDIAVDSCTGTIFWTHSSLELRVPAIEKASISDTQRTVLITSDLFMPTGIAIDHLEQRIYWADKRQGIYFRIESADFDGNHRRVLLQGTHQKPFRLAVDTSYVYWTDTNNNALWRLAKTNASEPEIVRSFHGTPSGIVARLVGFPEEPNCDKLAALIKQRLDKSLQSEIVQLSENKTREQGLCSNATSQDCFVDVCYNFCHNGKCQISHDGRAKCVCEKGYNDERCERHVCDNYCLNGGACSLDADSAQPKCSCSKGFYGHRCDIVVPISNFEICQSVCENASSNIIVHNLHSFLCRCSDLTLISYDSSNCTQSGSATISGDVEEIVKHPVFIGMIGGNLITLLLVVFLIGYICKQKRIRPRIKKRVVLNKNVTPLTYRPQNGEVCEITIEDCCNMNICETPCFEPRKFAAKKDDKKALLNSMEHNEEFY